MGSRLVALLGALLSSQNAVGEVGHESSKVTRKVVRSEMNMAVPVFQLTPIDGSPASVPFPVLTRSFCGVNIWKRGGNPVACFAGPNPATTVAVPTYWSILGIGVTADATWTV